MKINHRTRALLFLTGLFILLFLISYLILPSNSVGDGLYKKANGILKEPEHTIDYIVIGDSEASTSISPMEIWNAYGYTGYNCGVPAQQLQDTYYLLERVLEKQSPKVVLLETNAFYRDFKYINALENTVEDTAKKLFPVYKYHNNWRYFHLYMLKNLRKSPNQGRVTVFKGFQYNTAVKPYQGGPYGKETDQIYQIGDQPLQYMNKIAELCRERGIELILYSSPSPKCWTYQKHNAALAFAKEKQLPYIDFNLMTDELHIDWAKDTRDEGDHINYYGGKKVSDYMGAYLKRHTHLQDHREEAAYSAWKEELKAYLAITKDH